MAFRREEYVQACLRRAAFFRRLAVGIAAAGSVFFLAAWLYQRSSVSTLWGIQPLPAITSAVCLAGVAITLIVGELLVKQRDSDSL
jgi:hypothetical protein